MRRGRGGGLSSLRLLLLLGPPAVLCQSGSPSGTRPVLLLSPQSLCPAVSEAPHRGQAGESLTSRCPRMKLEKQRNKRRGAHSPWSPVFVLPG